MHLSSSVSDPPTLQHQQMRGGRKNITINIFSLPDDHLTAARGHGFRHFIQFYMHGESEVSSVLHVILFSAIDFVK